MCIRDRAQTAPTAASDTDAAKQLADTQDKLSTALRSFSVLQDEDTQLRTSLDKANADNASLSQQLDASRSTLSSTQAQAASSEQATGQIDPLRSQLRAALDQSNQFAAENEQLRNRLALLTSSPGSPHSAPLRPGQAPAYVATPAAPPSKTYVVVQGDTLTKISRKFYGTSSRWQDILNANRGVVKNETSLVVGSSLTIP